MYIIIYIYIMYIIIYIYYVYNYIYIMYIIIYIYYVYNYIYIMYIIIYIYIYYVCVYIYIHNYIDYNYIDYIYICVCVSYSHGFFPHQIAPFFVKTEALLRFWNGERGEHCEGVQFLEGHVTHARFLEAKHSFRYAVRGWATGMVEMGEVSHGGDGVS